MIRIRKTSHVPHVSSDTFRDIWGNLKFCQKGIPGEHNIHLKNSMVDFGRERTKAWPWACETQGSLCCEWSWNSLGVCAHAAVFASTLSAAFLLSFGGKPWPLPLPRNYKRSSRDTHAICRRKFWLGSAKLSGWSPRNQGIDNHLSHLPPPNSNFKRKKKKKHDFPDLRTRLFGGFGKLIFDSCPISSCTDVVPIKKPQNHISFFIFQSVSLASPSLQNYQARKLWILKRSWFYGSILPSLSWFYGSILPS